MSETRKLAAILVSDVVGYSRLAGADEDRILARLRTLRSDLIDPIISVHHGRVVKRTGDGAIVEFRSVVDAVNCAIEVQRAMVERNAGVAPDKRIEFRIGIHLGDVVEESDGDLMGDGVNIAARLEGIAKPGAICLSEDAYRQVKGRLDLAVADLGQKQLKNIAEPIRVYSVKVEVPARSAPPTPRLALPDKPSIAVLPFQNMSDDPIRTISSTAWSRTSLPACRISRSSSSSRAIRASSTRGRLWTSVRSEANSACAMCSKAVCAGQAAASSHCSAGRSRKRGAPLGRQYDGAFEDVFDLQDRITDSVVGVGRAQRSRQSEVDKAGRPENLDAYDLFLSPPSHGVAIS